MVFTQQKSQQKEEVFKISRREREREEEAMEGMARFRSMGEESLQCDIMGGIISCSVTLESRSFN